MRRHFPTHGAANDEIDFLGGAMNGSELLIAIVAASGEEPVTASLDLHAANSTCPISIKLPDLLARCYRIVSVPKGIFVIRLPACRTGVQ
jgi:hypothetical protein